MKEYLDKLISYALDNNVSDIHFYVKDNDLTIYMRNSDGMFLYKSNADMRVLEYLRFVTNMDLSGSHKMQSGSYVVKIDDKQIPIRFSYISTPSLINGALRILEPNKIITIENLSCDSKQNRIFKNCCRLSAGLILLSGATGSGKTTTLYALIDECCRLNKSVFTIEDPIEMLKRDVVQLQIHEPDVTYEKGLKQILRHDPDVIMVGEIRDALTAKMVIRCALTGHLVFSTIHANSAAGVVYRLMELGVGRDEIRTVLRLVSSQQIVKGKQGKLCVYDIMQDPEIERVINGEIVSSRLDQKILALFDRKLITKSELKKMCIVDSRIS